MSKMKLVLLDADTYFIDRITAYTRTSDYASTFTVSAFTNREQGFSYIERSSENFILLVHESFIPLPELVFQRQHGCMLIVSDFPATGDIVEYPVVCKFQPLNQLLAHVISHYNEFTSSRMLKGDKTSQVVSVYSAVGGSGKTLTALHLARELALVGRNVFYINLEQLPSTLWIEQGESVEEHCFSRMLYYGKSDAKLQIAKVERYKRRHSVFGFDYFPGNGESLELAEMSEKDTESLVKAVLATGAYDCVLLDLDSSLFPRVKASLKVSDHVLWLVQDDSIQWEKCHTRMSQWMDCQMETDWRHKCAILVNKFNGTLHNSESQLPLPIAGYLPYIPEWKSFGRTEIVLKRSAFSESLASLNWFRSLVQEETSDVER
ncbi:AAA family ATPase [Paenibacillus sp. UNC451MF]|uniref:AAA family ATPase n=1 Tax=Paenibacillus sp. UNC451MF TaxID=1449063 RepID=UPI00048E3B2B|nr:AAA family ATPase [Paenibacillus sp. UNC451MF]